MKKTLLLAAVICISLLGTAQNSDEDQIKKVMLAETEAFFARNLEAWRATWAHSPTISRSVIANNYHYHQVGWDSANAQMERMIKNNSTPEPIKVENKNYQIVQRGDMAWAHYDQVLKNTSTGMPDPEGSKEYRVLVKENNNWKLIAQVTTFPETFDLTKPQAVEDNLNALGYAMLQTKKMDDAIALFKMNVKLFPESWNTYDSLAEAYAAAGNKKEAIENYEKSVKLNPKNEQGAKALAKLKMQ